MPYRTTSTQNWQLLSHKSTRQYPCHGVVNAVQRDCGLWNMPKTCSAYKLKLHAYYVL